MGCRFEQIGDPDFKSDVILALTLTHTRYPLRAKNQKIQNMACGVSIQANRWPWFQIWCYFCPHPYLIPLRVKNKKIKIWYVGCRFKQIDDPDFKSSSNWYRWTRLGKAMVLRDFLLLSPYWIMAAFLKNVKDSCYLIKTVLNFQLVHIFWFSLKIGIILDTFWIFTAILHVGRAITFNKYIFSNSAWRAGSY